MANGKWLGSRPIATQKNITSTAGNRKTKSNELFSRKSKSFIVFPWFDVEFYLLIKNVNIILRDRCSVSWMNDKIHTAFITEKQRVSKTY